MENSKEAYQNNANAAPTEVSHNETLKQTQHQHNNVPQYYPYGHPHSQMMIGKSRTHQLQSPLHLSIPPNQQIQYQTATTHRHFQYYPQYTVTPTENTLFPVKNQIYLHQHNQRANNLQGPSQTPVWTPLQPPPDNFKDPKSDTPALQQQKTKEAEKKKSTGNNPHLRSPTAKRPPDAPVTMQGWLHKQGSEGLMLWKKRWFVLSEYCLFYYKGSSEEKLLGSILLPSYKVSVCGPEDKINKKYSFKCEHANMRTYILAADSHELMMQWVRVLNFACNLQNVIGTDQQATEPPVMQVKAINVSVENSNSNCPQQIKQNNLRKNPVHTHTSSNTTDVSNSSQQELTQYNQPLYANAPPKPRRLTDTGYSSPSPEVVDKYNYPRYNITPISQQGPRIVTKSPTDLYRQVNVVNSQASEMDCMHSNEHVFREFHNIPHNVDRRTPDTYGRSKLTKFRNPSDYEDIYVDQDMYKRPLSPVASNNMKKGYPNVGIGVGVAPFYKSYTPVNMLGPREFIPYDPVQMRKSVTISRPHSADFLEYKINQAQSDQSFLNKQQPRPKSSLEINKYSGDDYEISHQNHPQPEPSIGAYNHTNTQKIPPLALDKNKNPNINDNYFYSQERYAEKMRKSAQYLHKIPLRYQPIDNSHRKHKEKCSTNPVSQSFGLNQQNQNNRLTTCNNLHVSDVSLCSQSQPIRSRSVLSEGSLLCAQDIENESISPDYSLRQDQYIGPNIKNINQEFFTRSASARLSQSMGQENRISDDKLVIIEGERKREESMKRLLEWKQRMLQSPLNRKAQINRGYPCTSVGRSENSYIYHNGYNLEKKQKKANMVNRRTVNNLVQYNSYSSDDEASGSISLNTRDALQMQRDTFPRAMSAKRSLTPNILNMQAHSVTNLDRNFIPDKNCLKPQCFINQPQSRFEKTQEDIRNCRNELSSINNKMSVSAGELLGRTHEELVLLLIQLRRQSAQTFQAIESCYNEIDNLQAQCHKVDQTKRIENLQKLEQIKQNLLELEKQYEKGKPLVNLVDNMVKLGSLYRIPPDRNDMARYIRDRLEFNQHIQERRLLAEEKREWNRLDPSHVQLQEKVQQLYQLDRLIQEESENLQNLQQDKEDIERALGGLRCRLSKGFNNPEEIEQARRQQIMLENELSRVHLMLAQNSKKLEETIAGNARLEQELLVLKQKLQISRHQRSSPQFSNAGDSLPFVVGTSAVLESDLQRVQKKIGDLQKQREELSLQVRQLTERSNNLQSQQKLPLPNEVQPNNYNKKKPTTVWRETDLDTMNIVDHGQSSDNHSGTPTSMLYINTDVKDDSDYFDRCVKSSDSTNEDIPLSSNLLEKQEIKTVRIVKRESERRQRDREKSSTGKCDVLIEEDDSSQSSSVLFRPTPLQKSLNFDPSSNLNVPQQSPSKYGPRLNFSTEKSPELSPIFKSEAARQIITEMSVQDTAPKQIVRRTVPREKRRHYTAPNDNLIIKSLHQLPTDDDSFEKITLDTRRARDDLDIERALRQRIDAPDIVRSTLSNKELKYNEETIDNILSTPNKIVIPERYIPEQLPQLTAEEQEHRLRKVESIKKMLSDTAIISTATTANVHTDDKNVEKRPNPANKGIANPNTSITEEKKQREHLLQLNQILAKQVMEMSKVVAGSNEADEK